MEKKKRVLVVEDEKIPREMYARKFQKLGAEVVSVSSAKEAIEALGQSSFTHVVCDGLEGRWRDLVPTVQPTGAILRVVSGRQIGDEVKRVGAEFVSKFDLAPFGKIPIEKLING